MTKIKRKLLWLVPLATMVGCTNTAQPINEKPINKKPVDIENAATCPIIESGKWHVWLDTHAQESGSFRLNVKGEVTLPNPAYKFEWQVGPTDRMSPPSVRLMLNPISQEGMAIQVLTKMPVNYTMQTRIPHYRNVSVYCGGKLLGEMSDIMAKN